MMGGGGSPQTFSSGGNPAPYQPVAQPAMDQRFQDILAGFPTSPWSTVPGQLFPEAQNTLQTYLLNQSTLPNYLQGAYGAANMGAAGAPALQSAGMGVLNTAFDPQQALYNRTLGQTLDQASVANAMAGIGGTPYGASNVANQARNFGIDWQNNLLNRQISGGQAGTGLLQAAPALSVSSGAAPFKATQDFGQQFLQDIGAVGQLGTTPYTLPQQAINDIESYLRLGQSASNLALTGGNLGFNQTAQGIGGLLSGANSLFGSNGLFGGSGGLFGGGSSALSGASTLGDLGGATGFATDTTGLLSDQLAAAGGGAADAGAGGFFSSLLPAS